MKFSGEVGFWKGDVETIPGIFKPKIEEKHYTGDIFRNNRRFQSAENQQNDNLVINNQITIVADLYMQSNMSSIRYVRWNGTCWKVNSVDINPPRLTLELGGVYNFEEMAGDQNHE